MRLVEQDIDWHDGNLVDVHVAGLPGTRQTVRLFLDLYPDEEGVDRRRRYLCTGEGLRRIQSGVVNSYVAYFLLGVLLILGYMLWP